MDPNSVENQQHRTWNSDTGHANVTWNYQTEHATPPPSSSYYYDPQMPSSATADSQFGINTASSHVSTSLSEASVAPPPQPQPYNNYYYPQQTHDLSYQQVGAGQNTGASYQPLTSFPNTGACAGAPSYPATYYNPGDHQTAAGYNHNSQGNNVWNYGSYPNYQGYNTSETNPAVPASSVPYQQQYDQQQYDQWAKYYAPAVPVVSCASGTENTPAPVYPVQGAPVYPVQGASGGYQYPSNQPPPPGTTSWRRDSSTSGLTSLQVTKDTATHSQNGVWDVEVQGFQNPQIHQAPSYFQKPLDSNPPLENYENQQKALYYSQGLTSQLSSTNQVSENLQPPLQTVMTPDTRRVSKMQIPTNPRIAPSSILGMPKIEKESSTSSEAMKPAYVSVSVPKPNNEVPSHADAEAMNKPGTLPTSLRAYVERTFARCKDDAQRAANQNIMMEMIKKASADGTLFTRNWDTESLFPLPNTTTDMGDLSNLQSSVIASSLAKYKRSPNRRIKSRWEPIAEDKLIERLASVSNDSAKDVSCDHLKGADKVADSRKYENKANVWNGVKFLSSQQQTPIGKIGPRPMKKPRFSDSLNVTQNGDASSDSDKEQSLTKYYASAIALADTPEERKRREHRSKRFEKGQGNQSESKHNRQKFAEAGNVYTRKTNSMVVAKKNEDGFNRAVEDMDWDALTVKGTCQEIEKRYLRLTAAPDPTTVRPEEILEKALHMVQTSQKNYLYKCDQLKSLRQDLTVQRIQNELTVKVYETHARLALEAGDLPEYNQCQTQLTRLYAEGIKGSHMEFSAYNLLCVILHSDNKRDLLSSMTRLSNEAREDDSVKHALAVRSAVSSGNYVLFFRLYKAAPNLSTCLMDLYVEKMRFEAVKCMSKSYRPNIPVAYIARVLSFSRAVPTEDGQAKGMDGLEECEEWLRLHGAVLIIDNNGESQLDAKASSSSLYMPEPEDAVAHGDASLGVDDFLTRATS